MKFFEPKLQDLTMETEYMTARVRFSAFGWRFRRAQEWLDREIMRKMEPVIPYRTGKFLGKIKANNAGYEGSGQIRVAVPPQGKYLYPGISPWGKPFNWTNPLTQPRWGFWVKQTYMQEFKKGVKDILTGKVKE